VLTFFDTPFDNARFIAFRQNRAAWTQNDPSQSQKSILQDSQALNHDYKIFERDTTMTANK
jgi:hypothetical protein